MQQKPTLSIADTEPDLELFAGPNSDLPGPPLVATAFGVTDQGRVRVSNQDQFAVATLTSSLWIEQSSFPQTRVQCGGTQGHLFIVADGLGGHAGGEQASKLAVEAVEAFLVQALGWLKQLQGQDAMLLEELKSALQRADAEVMGKAAARPELAAMGTTLTLACSIDDVLYIAHAGDSRCYLRRAKRLHQVTHDHTFVGELVSAGALDASAARTHDLRHLVTNVVGGGRDGVRTEVHKVRLKREDVILLCTDGLTEMLPLDCIDSILESQRDPDAAAKRLVVAANEAGGSDNITALVARFDVRPAPAPRGSS